MASSEDKDEHSLGHLIRKGRLDDAMSRIQTEEGREELSRKSWWYRGQLPLHHACCLRAPSELVEAMIGGYPESVRVTDNEGQLPLHHASFGGGSPRVVRLLVGAYPEGAKAADNDGLLPLHYAALSKAPLEDLTMIINAHAKGVTTRDNYGRLPLHDLADEASPDENHDVEKIQLLLRPLLTNEEARHCSHPRSGETPLHIGARFDLLGLNECMRMSRCPADVIIAVAERHPDQLRRPDEDGSLPLHLVAANPDLNGVRHDGREDLVVKLVRLYPDAAAMSDGEGRAPLNLAIESGKHWTEGVEAIADAAKGVRTIRDVGTNLFPFMLAASGTNPCITTIYELIRCGPDICKKP